MDLRESYPAAANRHPWELARSKALRRIAFSQRELAQGAKVLDLGCGDGFLIDELCPHTTGSIDAVDIHLTSEQLTTFSTIRPRVNFHNSYDSLPEKSYELITMFDVLEHIDDDLPFLQETISRFAKPGALLFCTVPAFQSLFSSHDVFLQHHRRYALPDLEQLLERAGLKVISSGYLFALLLPIRALAVSIENLFGTSDKAPGIGHWHHGRLVTAMLTTILDADTLLLSLLGKIGLKFPGLTVWALCQTPQ
ncbi:MAG: class I SAM-dependent methyltransferase [Desulfobulbaceae bacterium]|nr:class I SAM-dependent methyltransferase [Desulfobulbaceae bacterium]